MCVNKEVRLKCKCDSQRVFIRTDGQFFFAQCEVCKKRTTNQHSPEKAIEAWQKGKFRA